MNRLRQRLSGDDSGFTLVEMMVALVVFALMSSGVLATLLTVVRTGASNRDRGVAADLASRQIEIARNMPVDQVLAFPNTPVQVDGRSFTVRQEAAILTLDGVGSYCDATDGSALAYKRVSVTVTWPSMGKVDPVRSDTLIKEPVLGADVSTGALVVKLVDAKGAGLPGHTVVVTRDGSAATVATQRTDASGCAVFAALPPGLYTASVSTIGYVGTDGKPTATRPSITVTAGRVAKATPLPYDKKAQLLLSYTVVPSTATVPSTPNDYTAPPTLLVTLASTPTFAATTAPLCPAAPAAPCISQSLTWPRTVDSLFPFPNGYVVYGDDQACPGATPSPAPAPLSTAISTAQAIVLGRLDVTSKTTGGARNVIAWRADNGTCPTQVYVLGKAGQAVRAALPFGTWTVATSVNADKATATSTKTVVVSQTAVATAVFN